MTFALKIGRKRIGVEPTKDCQAAPPGFEVRTSHRGANLFQNIIPSISLVTLDFSKDALPISS